MSVNNIQIMRSNSPLLRLKNSIAIIENSSIKNTSNENENYPMIHLINSEVTINNLIAQDI